ncbi:MAG: peptidyl-tRNA hydrolase, family [Thermoproteota archaeon]|nr:peptidyl-tRNA hydrolase, family [Thermoproteota archaeon]
MAETFRLKQVIVIRKDLKMGIGKMVSQACHACLDSSEEVRIRNPNLWKSWHSEGAKKVVVKVQSLEELLDLKDKASRLRIPNSLVIDRGLTQINPNTPTALGIGPAKTEDVDKITKQLRLL